MNTEIITVWCLLRDQYAHIRPVEDFLGARARFIYDTEWDSQKILIANPDIIICVNDYLYEIGICIDVARKAKIPTLVLQDGILEWRCQYENPLFKFEGGVFQHQPVLADKIACIGAQSARQIAAWGNPEKVEVTGMPKLDFMFRQKYPVKDSTGKRLLVMTAKKPWFDEAQREITLRSLMDVKKYLSQRTDIQVVWRLTKDVEKILAVENRLDSLETVELAELLANTDAVITTYSTAILEAMLAGKPVAALDYHNVPHFFQTAWNISASDHIALVIKEIFDPPPLKMIFQRDCLNDVLRCDNLSSENVATLILRMCAIGREARLSGKKLSFPKNLLAATSNFPSGCNEFTMQQEDANREIGNLRANLARAQAEISRQRHELESRTTGYWIKKAGQSLWSKIRRNKK